MKKWNIVFDVALCTGCQNCAIAVQDEYVGNSFPGYAETMPLHSKRWVELQRHERGQFPVVDLHYLFHACQHCDDPPCQRVAREGAVVKRQDGIVLIDPVRAKGQRQIVDACPYGAVVWNEEKQLPQHWNFDAHLIDAGWLAPRPVQACPTGALRALKVEDVEMRRIVAEEKLMSLAPEYNCRSRIHYRNLDLVSKAFVAGTLIDIGQGDESCLVGAAVQLWKGANLICESISNIFGDFRFDALEPNSGPYKISIAGQGDCCRTIQFEMADSCWLGEVRVKQGSCIGGQH